MCHGAQSLCPFSTTLVTAQGHTMRTPSIHAQPSKSWGKRRKPSTLSEIQEKCPCAEWALGCGIDHLGYAWIHKNTIQGFALGSYHAHPGIDCGLVICGAHKVPITVDYYPLIPASP